jgi:hypothetical protein
MQRKVVLNCAGQNFDATLRNISVTGALVKGMRNVTPGTEFVVVLSSDLSVDATCRWCEADLVGLQFITPLDREDDADVMAIFDAFPAAATAS